MRRIRFVSSLINDTTLPAEALCSFSSLSSDPS